MTSTDQLTETLAPEERVRAWIGDRLPGEGPFHIRRITAGHSNELLALQRGGFAWALRRPPRVLRSPKAHDMVREYRILEALEGSAVPHARPYLLCEDPAVIGTPFYVMEYVEGISLYDRLPPHLDSFVERRRIGEVLFDTLAELHLLDWVDIGLGSLGSPETFTQRQVGRWMQQLESYRIRELPDLDAAADWLTRNTPAMQRPALIHGDFGLHNVLYSTLAPAEIRAVVDWETATIGDPLMDLGYLLSLWLQGEERHRWFASALPYDISGFGGRQQLADRYAARTGLDLSALTWYRAVAQLKVACILEGGYARHLVGESDDPDLARLEQAVPNHAAYALAIARGEA